MLDKKGLSELMTSCLDEIVEKDDYRVRKIFKVHDKDKDGYMTLEDFLEFYYDVCVDPEKV